MKGDSEWKRIVDKSDARALVQTAKQNGIAMADKLCAKFNVGREHPASLKTVRREHHRAGYLSRL